VWRLMEAICWFRPTTASLFHRTPQAISATVHRMSGWDGPTILTFIVSLIAILISVFTLVWRIHEWRQSGAVLTVHCYLSTDNWPGGLSKYVGVTATNTGRAATTLTSIGINMRNRPIGTRINLEIDEEPFTAIRLEPGESKASLWSLESVARACANERVIAREIVGAANTGHGHVSRSFSDSDVLVIDQAIAAVTS
jgi:hypothetical protein